MLVYITLAERKSELEAAEMVNFLLAFKCIILQIRDKKKSMVPVFFFPKNKTQKVQYFNTSLEKNYKLVCSKNFILKCLFSFSLFDDKH